MGKIMVNGENYSGSEVVANPTLAGTEPSLTGLEVDGTKYAVSGGGGGGGSIEIKQILDNSAWASPTTYELTESVYNFDFIIFVCAYNFGGNQVTCSNILPSDYLTIRMDAMANWHYIQMQCWEHFTLFAMNNPSASGGAGDKIDYVSDSGTRGILRNIYGVKFSTT